MTKDKPTNIAASIRAKLQNVAKESKRAIDVVLLQYLQERFLYRLSQSAHRSKLILKGALMFRAHGIAITRPTKDIDFLGRTIGPEETEIQKILKEILEETCDDGVVFDKKSLTITRIKEDADYEGLRIFLDATLDSARKKIQIDIGFGDLITNGPTEMQYPVFLDLPTPKIMVYSKETAIAEKFEAIVRLGTVNSRMKDFYDILFLSENEDFDSRTLTSAILQTFNHRATETEQAAFIFSVEFKEDQNFAKMWRAFLSRSKIECEIEFSEAVTMIDSFLGPIILESKMISRWSHRQRQWNL